MLIGRTFPKHLGDEPASLQSVNWTAGDLISIGSFIFLFGFQLYSFFWLKRDILKEKLT